MFPWFSSSSCGLALVLVLSVGGGVSAQGTSCWEPVYGTVAATGDTALSPAITLPFAFPKPGGGTTTQIRVSTNGFIWLDGTSVNNFSDPSVPGMLGDAARICVGYADLKCSPVEKAGNGVYVNTSIPGRAVVTFIGNDLGASPNNVVFMQAQLLPDGSFTITHRQVDAYRGYSWSNSHDMIVGVTQGGGATDPGESDFTAGPILGNASPTIYELFPNPYLTPQDPRDVDTIPTLIFSPNGNGGYNVIGVSCSIPALAAGVARGVGCPDAGGKGLLFEHFLPGNLVDLVGKSVEFRRQNSGSYQATVNNSLVWQAGFSNRIDNIAGIWGAGGSGDDGLSLPQPLGFTATYWNNPPSTDAYVCTNGRVFLAAGGDGGFQANPQSLLFGPACVAAYSSDLDASASSLPAGAGIYVDRYPAAGQTPARCVVTYDRIPRLGVQSETLTAQVHLYSNGDITISTQANNITQQGDLGIWVGGQSGTPVSNSADSTNIDIALVPPGVLVEVPSGYRPLEHYDDFAVLGTTPRGYASELPAGALASVLQLGIDQVATPLDLFGMPGCTAYTLQLLGSVPMVQNGTTASVSLGPIPNLLALAGGVFTTQVLTVVPGINPLQIIASNGWDATIGQ